jgi:hypothetical protein
MAVSIGAALLAEEIVTLRKTAPYSIGLFLDRVDGRPTRLLYAIHYNQEYIPGKAYYIPIDPEREDTRENRLSIGGIGRIDSFAIEWSENSQRGNSMKFTDKVKSSFDSAFKNADKSAGFWYVAFSMDNNGRITFILEPDEGNPKGRKPFREELGDYNEMFDLQSRREYAVIN